MASEQDFDTSVMENEQLKQEVEDKMKEMEDRATGRLQAEIAATREQMKAQFGDLMDLLAKGQGQQGNGRGRNNKMVKVYEAPCGSTQGFIWEIARNSEGYVDGS